MKRNRSSVTVVSFDATREEMDAVKKIARRSVARRIHSRRVDAEMDVLATHSNGCPLRLAELSEADAFNFAHDMVGILRHLDRETGRLGRGFLPRFAQKAVAS